jgi:hypothetical protein
MLFQLKDYPSRAAQWYAAVPRYVVPRKSK